MTEQEIENEVQARVAFKMNELLDGVKNAASRNWSIAFNSNSQKHEHYWDAFTKLKEMLQNELSMATPYNDMSEQNRRQAKDKAVDELTTLMDLRGRKDSLHITRSIVASIEKAQKY